MDSWTIHLPSHSISRCEGIKKYICQTLVKLEAFMLNINWYTKIGVSLKNPEAVYVLETTYIKCPFPLSAVAN